MIPPALPAGEPDRLAALQASCDDYDTKPVDLPRLLAKTAALLPGAPGPRPTRRLAPRSLAPP